MEVLDDDEAKLKLFIGHTVRCKVQNTVIDEACEELLRNEQAIFVMLTMDYKMKYEPKKNSQKSSDWYVRKGIRWHGVVLTYRDKTERLGLKMVVDKDRWNGGRNRKLRQ